MMILLAVSAITSSGIAQDLKNEIKEKQPLKYRKYCARLKDKYGAVQMMSAGKNINTDITLDNGTIIKANGNIIRMDGKQVMLVCGECVDETGNLSKSTIRNKY